MSVEAPPLGASLSRPIDVFAKALVQKPQNSAYHNACKLKLGHRIPPFGFPYDNFREVLSSEQEIADSDIESL